ncbi:adenosylcobinamide-GDP ribazoletransferase [Gemmobacter serpentinus]|uniref:adenosylcobinamide-GDP ribazoletransferase n=1 Tax=Gemmobacter serpentinus TaxID=2652247 RepID=UPI00124D9247|nr:adenosylcobinamide-GDP ribazoletransferase [Gemmobacter serpentinus]
MPKLDPIRDLRAGLSLLTRLPLPPPATFPNPPAVWVWPLVGGLVGTISAGIAMAGLTLGLPANLAAALLLAMSAVLTGALHEDGLADCADGFWGGWTRARRLEIMKDSHIGSYGVMALILVSLGRWSAATVLLGHGHWPALIAAAILSRVPMAVLMATLPNARGSGLSAAVGRPTGSMAALAIGVALAAALALTGIAGLGMALAVLSACVGIAALARAKIGGQTGDVLGASQQLAELAAVAAACALLA